MSTPENTLTLPKDLSKHLAVGDSDEGFEFVRSDVVDQWRWGPEIQSIIKDSDGNYWLLCWRRQTDWEWSDFDEWDDGVEWSRVVPVEKVVIKYVLAE